MSWETSAVTQKPKRLWPSCPHCEGPARIRKSESLTPIYRNALLECQNGDCGWRGSLSLEITQTLTPSRSPNPEIDLPVSPQTRSVMLQQLAHETG